VYIHVHRFAAAVEIHAILILTHRLRTPVPGSKLVACADAEAAKVATRVRKANMMIDTLVYQRKKMKRFKNREIQ